MNKTSLHSSLVQLYRATQANKGYWTESIDNAMQQAASTVYATNKLIGALDLAIERHMSHLITELMEAKQRAADVSNLHSSMLQTLLNQAQELDAKLRSFRLAMQKDEEGR